MHTHHVHSANELPLFKDAAFSDPRSHQASAQSRLPQFVQSVVEEAGLGRFVYLRGCSGRRYVFSAVRPDQIALYENAVFAYGGVDGLPVELACDTTGQPAQNDQEGEVYVHLLADGDAGRDVIADLSGAMQ